MTTDESVEYVIDLLKPLKDDIVYNCIGNHEQRLINQSDHNLMRTISRELECKYGYQYLDEIRINNRPLRIYCRHGKGSSKHSHTAESKTKTETRQVDADLHLEGHNHRLAHFDEVNRTPNWLRTVNYVFTGAFLKYKGYPDQMQLPILPEAFLRLNINKDLIIDSTKYRIHERKPNLIDVSWELGDYS